MRYSDSYIRKKNKERSGSQGRLSSTKPKDNSKKPNKTEPDPNKNIYWLYDYSPLKGLIAIVFAALIAVGVIFFYNYTMSINNHERENLAIIDAAKKNNPEKNIELIKSEKIAEELGEIVIGNEEIQPVIKYKKANKENENQVYMWINKKGNKVYSNKKPDKKTNIPYKDVNP